MTYPSSPSGALDPSVLQCLGQALEDVSGEFVRELTAVYEAQALDLMEQLSAAAQAGDMPRINFLAHSLKGSSANVGGHRVVDLCAALEHWDGSPDQVTQTVAALHAEVAALIEDLRAFTQQ